MHALQNNLARPEHYCSVNQLDLNPIKCSLVTLTIKTNPIVTNYTLACQVLHRSAFVIMTYFTIANYYHI